LGHDVIVVRNNSKTFVVRQNFAIANRTMLERFAKAPTEPRRSPAQIVALRISFLRVGVCAGNLFAL
jgi:hypothetical protein